MSVLSVDELPRIEATEEYKRAVVEANRKLAEREITRIDYRGTADGLRRFLDAMEAMK